VQTVIHKQSYTALQVIRLFSFLSVNKIDDVMCFCKTVIGSVVNLFLGCFKVCMSKISDRTGKLLLNYSNLF